MKIGVVGAGVVGGTLVKYLTKKGHEVVVDDPPRGVNGDCSQVDALFVCVPADTVTDKRTGRAVQDLSIVKGVLTKYQGTLRAANTPVFLRTTLLPKTADNLAKFYKLRIISCPEFLTEREAEETMAKQEILVGGAESPEQHAEISELAGKIFPDKAIVCVRNREAELAKYAHNVMGSIKVNFFNLVWAYAREIRCDFENVREGVLLSGYINEPHTLVPGPDGKRGFAGKCFPKDTLAFIGEASRIGLHVGSLEHVMFENFLFRTERDRDVRPAKTEFPVFETGKP